MARVRRPGAREPDPLSVYILVIFGAPISWKKCLGGHAYEWIGYWQDLSLFACGLSCKRATWLARWLQDQLDVGAVVPRVLGQVTGRLLYGAIAVDFIKPFLGPIYAWTSAMPQDSFLALPKAIIVIFKFFIKVFQTPDLYMARVADPESRPFDYSEVTPRPVPTGSASALSDVTPPLATRRGTPLN